MEEQGERGGSGQGLQSNACVRALPERSEGIRYVRRNGAHSVSDCVEKAWRPPSKDTDVRRYACPVCGGRENENSCMMSWRAEPERHDAASQKSGGCEARILVQGGRLALDMVLDERSGSCK